MSGKIRVVLNRKGVRCLLRSDEMASVCRQYADKAAGRLGDGYEVSEHVGRNRVNASVRTRSAEAVRDNYNNNSILKAVYGK